MTQQFFDAYDLWSWHCLDPVTRAPLPRVLKLQQLVGLDGAAGLTVDAEAVQP